MSSITSLGDHIVATLKQVTRTPEQVKNEAAQVSSLVKRINDSIDLRRADVRSALAATRVDSSLELGSYPTGYPGERISVHAVQLSIDKNELKFNLFKEKSVSGQPFAASAVAELIGDDRVDFLDACVASLRAFDAALKAQLAAKMSSQ